jgi:hypothetical protein
MPARRPIALLLPVLLLVAFGSLAAPARTAARTPFVYDLYFSSAYERQVDSRTCTAASTAMMVNIIAGQDLNLYQPAILRFEQSRDALNNATQRGSDPLGWSRAATYFSGYTNRPTEYDWEAHGSEASALKRAATLIAKYSKPVGLLVAHGTHAVVMTGFQSTRNPNRGDFTLTHVYYSDPNGSRHVLVTAGSSPLDTYLELDATATYDKLWYGKFVIIAPQN